MVWWTLALAAGQGILQASGQRQQANAINRAQRAYEKLNAKLAREDFVQAVVALSARRLQERGVLARSVEEVSLDATRRIGAASVSAGESGISGNTQAALIRDFKMAQLKSQSAIMDTEKYMQEQYDRDVKAAQSQAASRILLGKQQRVPDPNYLQIFVDSATSYMQMQSQYNAANTYQGQPVTNASVPGGGGGGQSPYSGYSGVPSKYSAGGGGI